ncbi:Ig-like domain-containing protein [Clostridiaceae bacterium UIB06]|uniref:Ig-like domain-containing protein n=1 Tax=Clostridium thailandense TaxID=2794346 RepID=A0A949U1F3_9CLOT|nr:transglutaminase domain-containing protein [Clostridium thailandense]MBV7274693.1 Ig-like domain-containing protein [Clostridium thailandense]MCH5137396.1 Ig-like domain-containing protein [Clostridiaceae bacterium UIB06]
MNCKSVKNVVKIFIIVAMILLPIQVQAMEVGSRGAISISQEYINTSLPKSVRIATAITVQASVAQAPNTSTAYLLSDLENIIKSNMYNRNTSFTVYYKGNTSSLKSDIEYVVNGILDRDDYLKYSYAGYGFKADGYENDVTINFSFKYLTTKSQEDFVDSKVNSILGQIIDSSMTNDQKEKIIHDYIVKNVQYDMSLTRYSAYDALYEGKTVCQGYALLTYKMLSNVGIETRIVTGSANNGQETESHAWNLVKINGNWYHLDCTWDDPVPDVAGRVRYDYYNLTDSKMELDHTWDHSSYPSATTVYEEPSAQTSVSGVVLSSESLLLKVGQSSSLKATVTPTYADNKNLYWESSDTGIVTVDSYGNIKALKEGSTKVSVKTEDGGYTDSCEINVVSGDGVNIDFLTYKNWSAGSSVAKNKTWSIKFTNPFDASTVNNGTILIYEKFNSLLYPIKNILISYNDNNDTIYVSPSNEYSVGKTYYLVITQNVLSKDGKAIPKPIVLTFNVQ